MKSSLPISCYIRVKNEADRIEQTIAAALRIAEEVIVIDSGSSDATVAIAEAAGARVIHQEWLGNGKQKRVGEDACKNDWLLDIDADEVVTEALADEVRELFREAEPAKSAYQFRIVTEPPIGNTWSRCCIVYRVKLYDRRKHRIPDHAAWDQFKVEDRRSLGRLQGALIHHSFRDIGDMMGKLNRASSVRAREKKLKPLSVVVFRIYFFLPVYFLRNFVKRSMWRAGVYGFSCALVSAMGRWLTDVKMYEQHKGLKL